MGKPRQLLRISWAAVAILIVLGALGWAIFFRNTPDADELQGTHRRSEVLAVVLRVPRT